MPTHTELTLKLLPDEVEGEIADKVTVVVVAVVVVVAAAAAAAAEIAAAVAVAEHSGSRAQTAHAPRPAGKRQWKSGLGSAGERSAEGPAGVGSWAGPARPAGPGRLPATEADSEAAAVGTGTGWPGVSAVAAAAPAAAEPALAVEPALAPAAAAAAAAPELAPAPAAVPVPAPAAVPVGPGSMAAGTEWVPARALPLGPGRGAACEAVGREVHPGRAWRAAGKGAAAAGGKRSERLAVRERAGGKETAAGPRGEVGPVDCSRTAGPVLRNRLVPAGRKGPSAQMQQVAVRHENWEKYFLSMVLPTK